MAAVDTHGAIPELPALPRRNKTAGHAAEILRRHIADGKLRPGTKLPEEPVSAAFAISRNTVREAFRLLEHERLLEHTRNRGMVVRTLTADDVRGIYTTRRLVQPLGIDAALHDASCVEALDECVDRAVDAANDADWDAVGIANIDFHRALVASCRSSHITTMFEHVLAELRLAFLQTPDRQRLHEPYIEGNWQIAALLADGDREGAMEALRVCLDAAERHLLGVLSSDSGPAPA